MKKLTITGIMHMAILLATASTRMLHASIAQPKKSSLQGVNGFYQECENYHLEIERPALCLAAQTGNADTIQAILERLTVVNPDALSGFLDCDTVYIKAAIFHESLDKAFEQALNNGHVKASRALLEHGANPNKTDNSGCGALLKATQQKNTEMVLLLLQHGAHVNQIVVAPDHTTEITEQQYMPTALSYALPNLPQNDISMRLIKELAGRGGRLPKLRGPAAIMGRVKPVQAIINRIITPLIEHRKKIIEKYTNAPNDIVNLILEFSDALYCMNVS